ncbi:acyltransferase 3 [hydrothermal vent metagenome]|uniref:Acyltransferase 3 n=1 Tax=hydrothermal vent metagenome TaxID=652676 RepID=A0A1W1BR31_9ZZZZ
MHNKLLFAEQLRAVAVIFVVFAHYGGVFWYDPNIPSYINAIPHKMNIEIPSFIVFINTFPIPHINWGPLGVDIFFLISGFVIPISLVKYTQKGFVIRRFFRLFPTYFISFLFVIIMIGISSFYFNNDFPYSIKTIFLHSIIGVREIVGIPSIDTVVWTLEVELKFYILSVIFISLFKKNSLFVFLLPISIFILLLINFLIFHSSYFNFIPIIYMFIGTAFYFHFKEIINSYKLIIIILLLLSLFNSIYYILGNKIFSAEYLNQMYFNAIYGLIIFGLSYLFRKKFKFNIILSFMANISYPFYIIHGISGYIIMTILLDKGISPIYLFPITISIVSCVAYLIHIYIETPSQKFAKKIS